MLLLLLLLLLLYGWVDFSFKNPLVVFTQKAATVCVQLKRISLLKLQTMNDEYNNMSRISVLLLGSWIMQMPHELGEHECGMNIM